MGIILDSSILIAAERGGEGVRQILKRVRAAHGETEAGLSAVTIVDLTRRTVRVAGKGGHRTVFFRRRAAGAVRQCLNGRASGPLFQPSHRVQHGYVHWNGTGWAASWVSYSRGKDVPRRTSTYLAKNLTYRQACEQFRKRPQSKLVRRPESGHLHGEVSAAIQFLNALALQSEKSPKAAEV